MEVKRRLLDTVRDAIRLRHYSRRTEEAYVAWIRRFIVFHGMQHPKDLGEAHVTAFVSALAARSGRRVCRWCFRERRSPRSSRGCMGSSG
jgi:hypothetical protein